MTIRKLLLDKRGAVVIEAALALPILVTLMIGMLQFSLVMQASGAMRNALGQGIRYAKVHPSATQSDVTTVAKQALAGVNLNGIQSLTYQQGTSNGAKYANISMTYKLTPIIPFAGVPPITLTETSTGYLPS